MHVVQRVALKSARKRAAFGSLVTSCAENNKPAKARPSAGSIRLTVLKNRSDFVSASKASYQTAQGLTVQMRDRQDGTLDVRVGFTCSKKVGNAVARNRAKRRLREIAQLDLPALSKAGHDYVLIGKREMTATRNFNDLRADFAKALAKLDARR